MDGVGDLVLVDAEGHEHAVRVRWWHDDDRARVTVEGVAGGPITAEAEPDVEAALAALRDRLDERGLLLLCNRFRRDAFVSGLARSMSGGLGCYLVRWGWPVSPSRIATSLDPAPRHRVVTAAEAEVWTARWIRSCGRTWPLTLPVVRLRGWVGNRAVERRWRRANRGRGARHR